MRENVVRTKFLRLSILSFDGTTRDEILNLLKVYFFLLFFFIISLVLHKLVEKDLQARLQLIFSKFEGFSFVALVSAFATLASGLVASARFVSSATLIIAAIVAVASTTIRGLGHDRALLLHVNFLSITPVIAPVIVTLVAAIVTTTTAATATTIASVIVVPALFA